MCDARAFPLLCVDFPGPVEGWNFDLNRAFKHLIDLYFLQLENSRNSTTALTNSDTKKAPDSDLFSTPEIAPVILLFAGNLYTPRPCTFLPCSSYGNRRDPQRSFQ